MGYNSTASDVFAKIVKLTIHNELWDDEITWYSPRAIIRVCLYDLKYGFGILGFSPNWPCQIVEILATEIS